MSASGGYFLNEVVLSFKLMCYITLAAMQCVDVVLILHGKQALDGGGRFTNSTFQMIGDMMIGFSYCDENWKLDCEKNSKQRQDKLQSEFGFNSVNF